jgi:hypothetical protein
VNSQAEAEPRVWLRGRREAIVFAATVGLGALLLFSIQPMLGKALLPSLGGSPLAWATVMVFFQSIVLLGYALAHATTAVLGPRRQAALHVALLAIGLLWLPLRDSLSLDLAGSDSASAILTLLIELAVAIGLPCLAVAGTAPTLQRWYSALGNGGNPGKPRDPYWLYVASNLGSLFALFAYPLLLEPTLGLSLQRLGWSAAYVLLVLLSGACAYFLLRASTTPSVPAERASAPSKPSSVTAATRARWVIYAAIPSALTLAATTHVTTDLAPVPLLWTTPLAIYLGSFALTFSRFGAAIRRWAIPLTPIAVLPLIPLLVLGVSTPVWVVAVVHLVALGWVSTVMHGELSATRPVPERLTSFYAWIGLGGALGGVFVALAAPTLFSSAAEYPLLVVVALALIPRGDGWKARRLWIGAIALGGLAVATLSSSHGHDPMSGEPISYAGFSLMLLPFLAAHRWHRAGAWGLAAILVLGTLLVRTGRPSMQTRRSLFASYRVAEDPGRELRYLAHGNTIHGAQSTRPELREWGLPYYPPGSPMPELFDEVRREDPRAAVLGLGIGAMAPIGAERGWELTFIELDPAVAELARQHFSFLDDCGARCGVVIGDGRIELARDSKRYDVIVLDAFSSSAVPIHLLTKEAFALYAERLRPRGILAVHITNRHVELADVVAATGAAAGFRAVHRRHEPDQDSLPAGLFVADSHWVLLERESEIGELERLPGDWQPLRASPATSAWSDDHANPLGTYRWRDARR